MYIFIYAHVAIYIQGLSRRYPAMYYEKYRHLLKKIQDTRNIVHRTMTPHSPRHLGTSHSSPYRHQLSCYICLNLVHAVKSLPLQR